MKRLIELTICSLLTVNSMAQQALWNGDSIVSPTINENRSVTFRLYAPNANKVEVEGDFLLPQAISTPVGSTESPGKVVMKKNIQIMREKLWNMALIR